MRATLRVLLTVAGSFVAPFAAEAQRGGGQIQLPDGPEETSFRHAASRAMASIKSPVPRDTIRRAGNMSSTR